MQLVDISNQNVVFTGRETGINAAARLMREEHVGSLIVVEDPNLKNIPVGIVTDRDLVVEVLAQDVDIEAITVGDVMSANLVTARADASLWDAMKLMRMHGVRRLPIITQEEKLVGIITIDDVMMVLASEFTELARVIPREQTNEVRQRSRP